MFDIIKHNLIVIGIMLDTFGQLHRVKNPFCIVPHSNNISIKENYGLKMRSLGSFFLFWVCFVFL